MIEVEYQRIVLCAINARMLLQVGNQKVRVPITREFSELPRPLLYGLNVFHVVLARVESLLRLVLRRHGRSISGLILNLQQYEVEDW